MTGARAGTRTTARKLRAIFWGVLASAVFAFMAPPGAWAFPHFTRQIGRDCGYCHSAVPKLNGTGRAFLFNGYRFEGEGEWRTVKDLARLPVSFEVEVEGIYDSVKTAGVRSEASDLKVEEAEIIAGGAFGKDGRLTALASAAVQQTADSFDTVIPKAFIQINDLVGPQAAGALNLKAGIGETGLPFLTPATTPVTAAMFADTLIGVIGAEERFVEVNGALLTEGDRTLAHRYRAGISRESVAGDNKLKGLYATWASTLDERYTLGAIFRSGKEAVGGLDVSYRRYGVAAEAEAGPVLISAGYFKSNMDEGADADDWLLEALYFIKEYTLGARFETVRFDGSRRAMSHTFMGRYDIMSSAFIQFEYRHRQDPDRTAGGGELEDKARLLLVALF